MESYKMNNLNSNEFNEMQSSENNRHDFNVNLWDFEGSNFFVDKNFNGNNSKRGLVTATINSKNKSTSSKNITKSIKTMKNKYRSINSSYVNYKNIINGKNVKSEKNKSDFNSKKMKMKHNSFVGRKYEKNLFGNNINEEYKKRVKKRFNYSVDYSRNDTPHMTTLLSNKNELFNKNNRLNGSLLIESLNNKTNNKLNNADTNISSLKNSKNSSSKFNNSNKKEKSNSTDINAKKNLNIRNVRNMNQNLYNNFMKKRKELKITPEKITQKQTRKKSVVSKREIENAEKYTNNLYKKKIFTHNYELQNKLKKEKAQEEEKKELSQCTFKPKLYSNKYNTRIQSQKNNHKNKSIYEKNSQWSNNLKEKKKKEIVKKMDKELQGCTFTPQISTLPKYINKRNSVSNREIIGEENYYNKMKKARKIKEEKKKGNDLIEKYDERMKKKDMLPRSIVTFGNFNLEKSEMSEESLNNNNIININNANFNNMMLDRYSFKNTLNNINNNNLNVINNDLSERTINNNFKIPTSISTKEIMSNNLELSDKKDNDLNINTNKFNHDKINIRQKSESSKNKINPSINFNMNSGNKNEINNNKINENLYQRDSNYDFDNNYIEDKFRNKIKANINNNINFINPSIHYEEKEHEKENMNISTGTVTKANSIVSLQKKSTHSLPDRPNNIENLFNFNINENKFEKHYDDNILNKNINIKINNNLQDEEFIRQKKLLMNELHNWSNYDEESNGDN
jgi:hypothetical protein